MALPDFAQVLRTFEHIRAPLGRWLPPEQCDELGERLRARSERLHPSIMVFGLYNAGKSTLLNALMGRTEATMADRPETATVTAYPWGDYSLLDTPGIDAPIEHETVAQEQLKNSEVVLFVVAAGGSTDEANTWQRLVEIVAGERQVMLIVNNKAGIKLQSEVEGINNSLRRHLQAAASERGVENILERVPVHWVNAKSALRGRLEDKPALVLASGLPELEEALSRFLRESDVGIIFSACRKDLTLAIEQANDALLKAGDTRQGEAVSRAHRQVGSERSRLLVTLNDRLDRDCLMARRDITNLITAIADGHVAGDPKGAMEEGAGRVVECLARQLTNALELELPITQQALNDIGEKLAQATLQNAKASLEADFGQQAGAPESLLSPAIREALKKIPMGNISGLTESSVKAALELGKEFLPKLFKGIGPKTMGRWASTAGRWAGPLVQVGTALYEVYQAVSADNAQKDALARRAQAIDDCAFRFIEELRDAYRAQVNEVVERVFEPVNAWLASQSEALAAHDHAVEADLRLFEQALTQLRSLK